MNLVRILSTACFVSSFLSGIALVYYDLHLWSRRERGYSLWDVAFFPRRWLNKEMYTEEGNHFRRRAIAALLLSFTFAILGFVFALLWGVD